MSYLSLRFQNYQRLIRWLIFNVIFALIPLGVSVLIRATHGQPVTLEILLANGELLLITAALTGAAVGEILGIKGRHPYLELLSGGACIVILSVAAIYFADVAAARAAQTNIDLGVIRTTSIVLYVSGLVSSGTCILLAES